MKLSTVLGILLILLGIASFVWQGIPYKKEKHVVEIGPIEATAETEEKIPLPPILGVLAFAGGIILVVAGSRRAKP